MSTRPHKRPVPEDSDTIPVRMDRALIQEVDRFAATEDRTRNNAIRVLIRKGLEAIRAPR